MASVNGHALQRQLTGGLPERNGGLNKARGREVMRQHLGFGGLDVREARLDHAGDLTVQLLPAALEQRVVGRVLYQRVLEGVNRIRRRAATEGQSGRGQLRESVVELGLRHRRDRGDQLVAEFASNRRPDLGDLLHRHEPIQPRHQRVSQRGRNGDRASEASILVVIAGLLQLARFENGLGQLLDKQRHTVGSGQDLLE